MTPDEENQEAIKRAIQSFLNNQQQGQRTPEQAAQAPNTPPNDSNLNANPSGQPQPSTPPTALNPGQNNDPSVTMQQNPQNLIDALKQKSRQQQLDDLMNAARQ